MQAGCRKKRSCKKVYKHCGARHECRDCTNV